MLIVLYGVATPAEFFAPYGSAAKNANMIYCPSQISAWSPAHGLHAVQLRREVNPITLQNYYAETDVTIPLGFFVKGEPCHLCGLCKTDRHFSGSGETMKQRHRLISCSARTGTDATY